MDPGNVILTPSIWHHRYDGDGVELARVSYKPTRKADCFVLLSLGVMPKGASPADHAMRVLQELGWTPPPQDEAAEPATAAPPEAKPSPGLNPQGPTAMTALADLLARVEGATADKQWALVRDAAKALLDLDDPVRSRVNALCDSGGFIDAALALVERALPGRSRSLLAEAIYSDIAKADQRFLATLPLALIAALLKALEAQATAAPLNSTSSPGMNPEIPSQQVKP